MKTVEEIAFELLVTLFGIVAVGARRASARFERSGFVHGAEERELLGGGSVDEILSEKFVALFVDAGETVEKTLAFVVVGPFGEDDVDEFVDARALCAGRVGFRNDQIGHGDDGGVLVRIQSAKRVAFRRMRCAKKCKRSGESAGNAAPAARILNISRRCIEPP